MPAAQPRTSSRTSSRTAAHRASAPKRDALVQLIDDHKRVKKAYKDFEALDPEKDAEQCERIVRRTLLELQVHTTLEEELLYPAARTALRDTDLIDEAEVEHESAHALIDQLMGMSPDDDKYAARFTVLCEYVLHHVKEEEKEMFPQLEKARLDWEQLGAEMDDRRAALMAEVGLDTGVPRRGAAGASREEGEASSDDADLDGGSAGASRGGSVHKATREEKPATGITSAGAAGSRKI